MLKYVCLFIIIGVGVKCNNEQSVHKQYSENKYVADKPTNSMESKPFSM